MKEVKCKNCGASFAPSDKFCSYCKSARASEEETEKIGTKKEENNENSAKQVIDTFKKMGLNSIALGNMFDSLFDK